ncbi:MAG: hypothetical protein ACJ8FT_11565 [Sphingomonas sp.]
MRIRWIAASLVAAGLASSSAPAQVAQNDTSQMSETQARQHSPGNSDLIWNLIGCLGLLGLLGLGRSSDNDGYTNDPI